MKNMLQIQREIVHAIWNARDFGAGRKSVDIVPFALVAVKNPGAIWRLNLRFCIVWWSISFHRIIFDNSIIRDEYTVHIGKMNDSANIALSVDTAHKLLDLRPNGDHDLIRRSEIAGQNISMNDLKFYRRGRKDTVQNRRKASFICRPLYDKEHNLLFSHWTPPRMRPQTKKGSPYACRQFSLRERSRTHWFLRRELRHHRFQG